jgi:cytochrome c5
VQFLGHDMRHGFRRLWAVVRPSITAFLISGCIAVFLSNVQTSARQKQAASSPSPAPQAVFEKYCVACHNRTVRTAGLELDRLDLKNPGFNAEVWEKVIAKLRAGSMPPPGTPRPDAATYRATAGWRPKSTGRGPPIPIRAGSTPSTVSIGRNTTMRSGTCSRSRLMSGRCCRGMRRQTAVSTISRMC